MVKEILIDKNITNKYENIINDENIWNFKSGKCYDSYKFMGSHKVIHNGEIGFSFTLWAPNAKCIYLTGEFNNWNKYEYKMININNSGIWSIFIKDIKEGSTYKYNVVGCDDIHRLKSDPYAIQSEKRPDTASIVYDNKNFSWNDKKWLQKRAKTKIINQPMNIYEVNLASFKRKSNGDFYTYEESMEIVDYVKDMGYTHIELMPITEHPLDDSWGYQSVGYYSATSRFGTLEQFKMFINKCHENNIGVILDFAYSHFCKDNHGLYKFDGSSQFEYEDPTKAENIGWGTSHFDLGKPEVKSFLFSNAFYWFKEFHIDGIRVDAVSSMLYLDYDMGPWNPNKYGGNSNLEAIEFMKEFNDIIKENIENPIIIAEESTAWPKITGKTNDGGLGFDYKWDMGWMNDTLRYMEMDPIYRKYHHNLITFSFMYVFSENYILPLSHDEVVHGKKSLLDKMPGDAWQKFASLRTLYSYYMAHPGKKLLFMGGEFAQGLEWRFSYGLEWQLLDVEPHNKMQSFVKDLNHLYKNDKSMHEIDNSYDGIDFIDPDNNEQSVVGFIRKSKKEDDFIICIMNFTPVVYYDYKVAIEYEGEYEEVLNSDDEKYFGSNQTMKNTKLQSIREAHNNKSYHLKIKVPPMGAVFIKPKDIKIEKNNIKTKEIKQKKKEIKSKRQNKTRVVK